MSQRWRCLATMNMPPFAFEPQWDFARRKRHMIDVAAKLAITRPLGNLVQAFFVFEAWMSDRTAQGTPLPEGMMPSDDPNRIETLVISHLDIASRHTDLVVFEMIRDGRELVDLALHLDSRQLEGENEGYGLLDDFLEAYEGVCHIMSALGIEPSDI